MQKLASHIHTHHSPDSKASVEDIVKELSRKRFKGCIISDHDIYGLTYDEEVLFKTAGITLLRGIEFTTKEGVHIIGISPIIKRLEKPPFFYTSKDVCARLKEIGAKIIVPHPNHSTGVSGGRLTSKDAKEIIQLADFVEYKSFKYGQARKVYGSILIGGDDAHYARDIGNVYNWVASISDMEIIKVRTTWKYKIRTLMVTCIRSRIYYRMKEIRLIQKAVFYVKIFIKKTGIDSSL